MTRIPLHQRRQQFLRRRKIKNVLMLGLTALTGLYGLGWLAWILTDVSLQGIRHITPALFLRDPLPPGMPGGGLRHAFLGQLIITTLAVLVGVPLGIGAGIYLAEYGKYRREGRWIRAILDVMVSSPSIVIGTVVYAWMVKPLGHFMGVAGSLSLAILMLPIVAITTEEMLRMVPDPLREAAYALGARQWQVIRDISLPAARKGIMTGVILAIARISGETAPLLFTSFNSPYTVLNPLKPMATLTVTIFQYAMGPYPEWHAQAWAAALVLVGGTLLLFLLARWWMASFRSPQGSA